MHNGRFRNKRIQINDLEKPRYYWRLLQIAVEKIKFLNVPNGEIIRMHLNAK